MAKLVECVPNFSEGRNKKVIDAIAEAISSTEGCSLLDVDPGSSTNRTVYSFVGSPCLPTHMGPNTQIPYLSNDSCVACERHRAKLMRVLAFHTGVILVCSSNRSDFTDVFVRITIFWIRLCLINTLKRTEWAPDYGPATFVASWGATVAGARKFLVAYNINLLSTKEQAHRIALDIREKGRSKDQPGLMKKVQGMGWYLEEANIAQVSTNILDFELMPVHTVYEEICSAAKDLNLPVVGSEIVGLIPLRAVLDCADFYIQRDRLFIVEEEHKVRLVISKLGLDSLGPFVPKERIIEYMVERTEEDKRLVSLSLQQFVRSVGARTAAPGGGSVSGAIAAMGAALGAMVGQMTYGKRQFDSLDNNMRRLIPPFHQAMNELLVMVDADSKAFSRYMAALKMPRNTSDEVKRREAAMQEGLNQAVVVPLSLAERVNLL
uniref:glutamate formimidoyltransferase n=1 Tax=Oncorhynchus kisutch TaxID=8019 RepID=A0A8C7KXV2_ONCKI